MTKVVCPNGENHRFWPLGNHFSLGSQAPSGTNYKFWGLKHRFASLPERTSSTHTPAAAAAVGINVSRPKPFSMSAYCIVLAAMGYGPLVHYYPRCVNSECGDSLCTCVRIPFISYRISSYVDEPLSVYGTLPPLNKKPIALSLFYSAWKCPMEYFWCYMANIDCPIHTSKIITFCFKNKYAWFF